MGCDIHCFVEAKVDNKWLLMDHPFVKRHYTLFGRIAGVRDEDQIPIAKDRGIPDDISLGTKLYYDCNKVNNH